MGFSVVRGALVRQGWKARRSSAVLERSRRVVQFYSPCSGLSLGMQHHLRTCSTHRPCLAEAQDVLATEASRHPACSTAPTRNSDTGPQSPPSLSQILPPEPRREVVFSTEVTILSADADQSMSTGVIRSSPTMASLVAELSKDEGVNALDEEP